MPSFQSIVTRKKKETLTSPTIENILEWFPRDFDRGDASELVALIRKGRRDGDPDEALDYANSKMDGAHGVEAIREEGAWDNYYGDAIAIYVNTGDAYTGTLLYDTEKEEFWLTTYGDWLELREMLAHTTRNGRNFVVKLDNLEDRDGAVMAFVEGKGAAKWAKDQQSIADSNWESDGPDFAYAMPTDHEGLVEELESEGYDLNLDEYSPPED